MLRGLRNTAVSNCSSIYVINIRLAGTRPTFLSCAVNYACILHPSRCIFDAVAELRSKIPDCSLRVTQRKNCHCMQRRDSVTIEPGAYIAARNSVRDKSRRIRRPLSKPEGPMKNILCAVNIVVSIICRGIERMPGDCLTATVNSEANDSARRLAAQDRFSLSV